MKNSEGNINPMTITDPLSEQSILSLLNKQAFVSSLIVLPVTGSTNDLAHELAQKGAVEGTVVIAGRQTKGRGRLERSFYSPSGSGIYMSLILRPERYPAEKSVRITTMAAVAVCEAIESIVNEKASIKWVNDIFMHERKVCGILTESAFNTDTGNLNYAVLGIGINAYEPEGGFPEEIMNIAGGVFGQRQENARNQLTAEILNHFMAYYLSANQTEYVDQYRQRSFVIGREVNVISAHDARKALVLGLDDECRLLVKYEDGQQDCLSSGEISIRF